MKDRYFIATASHITEAQSLEVVLNGKPVKILGRASHYGPSWIEIEKPEIEPIAQFDKGAHEIRVGKSKFNELLESGNLVQISKEHWLIVPERVKKDPRYSKVIQDAKNYSLGKTQVPMDKWMGFDQTSDFTQTKESAAGDRLASAIQIIGGTSGSAILTRSRTDSDAFRVVSVANQFSRDFIRSVSPSESNLIETLEAYSAGKSKMVEGGRWRLRHGLTILEMGDGTVLTNPVEGVAGNGGSGDGGNGGAGDGGNGRAGDGGNGSAGDGGSDGKSTPTQDSYLRYKIAPGIQYKDPSGKTKAVIAFEVDPEFISPAVHMYPKKPPYLLFADLPAMEVIRGKEKSGKVRPVELGEPLVPSLRKRLYYLTMNLNGSMMSSPSDDGLIGKSGFEILDNGQVRMMIVIRNPRQEVLSFVLEPDGTLVGQKEFRPVLHIKGPVSGETYHIDLRNFFFIDLESVDKKTLKAGYADQPRVIVRRQGAPQESEVVFFESVPKGFVEQRLRDLTGNCDCNEFDQKLDRLSRLLREIDPGR